MLSLPLTVRVLSETGLELPDLALQLRLANGRFALVDGKGILQMQHQQAPLVIVGAVAAGTNVAVELRKLDATRPIVLLEQDTHFAYSTCGLPYGLTEELTQPAAVYGPRPAQLADLYQLDIRLGHAVVALDPSNKTVTVDNRTTAEAPYLQPYSDLVLATGARAAVPPIEGLQRPNHFLLRTPADLDRLKAWLTHHEPKTALVLGAGYVGLEVAEQLHERGLQVTVVDVLPQVLKEGLDGDMAALVHETLEAQGITLSLDCYACGFLPAPHDNVASLVCLDNEQRQVADIVVLSTGIRPNSELAEAAGLTLGRNKAIVVDTHLRTSHPNIYALGDVAELCNRASHQEQSLALAGPAHRQAWVLARHLAGHPEVAYPGVIPVALLKLFDRTIGFAGLTMRQAGELGLKAAAVLQHGHTSASYVGDTQPITVKLVYDLTTQRLLGGQVVGGRYGVDKRVDVLATALSAGMTLEQLALLDLGYQPYYNSPKDVVHLAAMKALDLANGRTASICPQHLASNVGGDQQYTLLDLRSAADYQKGSIPGALSMPLKQLLAQKGQGIAHDKPVVVFDETDSKAVYAAACLKAEGHTSVLTLEGGYRSWLLWPRVARQKKPKPVGV